MKFKEGQEVAFLYEKGGGVIESISSGQFFIRDDDGFLRPYKENELATVHSNDHGDVDHVHDVDEKPNVSKKQVQDVWSIDLHIEELVESHVEMSNYDIVQKQLRELRLFINKAQANKIRKVVVIHGVGEGVLKREALSYLRGIQGVETYDGNFWEYGQGATVVEIRYKY